MEKKKEYGQLISNSRRSRIMAWVIDVLKGIGGFFKNVGKGMLGVFYKDFEDILKQTVKLFMYSDLSGEAKFAAAFSILKGFAAKQGKSFADNVIRAAIELKVFEIKADDEKADVKSKLEGLIDYGLEEARQAVLAVEAGYLVDSDEKRQAAIDTLLDSLEKAGKDVITKDKNLLNLLIELALDSVKTETEEIEGEGEGPVEVPS